MQLRRHRRPKRALRRNAGVVVVGGDTGAPIVPLIDAVEGRPWPPKCPPLKFPGTDETVIA